MRVTQTAMAGESKQKVGIISLKPIGFVKTQAREGDFKTHRRDIVSEIVVSKQYSQGLKGIGEYSHLFILFWLHKVGASERRELSTHPKHTEDLPKVGIFSTRHANHPNPIGLTVAKLLGHRSNVIKVEGLDALDGTPVLDIKPYDYIDVPERIRVPDWWLKLHA